MDKPPEHRTPPARDRHHPGKGRRGGRIRPRKPIDVTYLDRLEYAYGVPLLYRDHTWSTGAGGKPVVCEACGARRKKDTPAVCLNAAPTLAPANPALTGAPPHIRAAVEFIAAERMRNGRGPTLMETWRHTRAIVIERARAGERRFATMAAALERRAAGETTRGRNDRHHADEFLRQLRKYGVRYETGVPHSEMLNRPVYHVVKTRLAHELAAGLDERGNPMWPPHDDHGREFRYRGPKGPIQ